MKTLPPIDYLNQIFELDAEAGVLRWKRRDGVHESWNTKYAGKIAGDPRAGGRMRVGIDNGRFLVHRIIFKMFYGYEPPEVDHRNADKADNCPTNLRPCNHGPNIANGKRRRKRSDLPKGVGLKDGSRYYAYIRKDGVAHHLGYFGSANAAHAAYCAAAVKFHGEFARFD